MICKKSWQSSLDSLEHAPMQPFADSPGCFSWAVCSPSLTPSMLRMLGKGTLRFPRFPWEKLCVLGLTTPKKRHDLPKEPLSPLV